MTIAEAIKHYAILFNNAGIDTPQLDAEVLISHILQKERHYLLANYDIQLNADEQKSLERVAARRLKREPVAYITGYKEFYSINFAVNKHVLIPRPDTELLVDLALFYAKQGSSVLDIGTGSGAIAISLKKNRPDLDVFACDISQEALKTAKNNAKANLPLNSIKFKKGDLFEPFAGMKFDLIISNPPYLDFDKQAELQKEIHYEPDSALFCEMHGWEITNQIISQSDGYLAPDGVIIIEIDSHISRLLHSENMPDIYELSIVNDYSGQHRAAILKRLKK